MSGFKQPPSTGLAERHGFHTTRWSLIQQVGGDATSSRAALEQLCRAYWYPLYAFVRRRGYDMNTSCDLTQGFFEQLLRRSAISVADPKRGRFRHFLMSSLSNFLSNEHAKSTALRRGGGAALMPIDAGTADTRYRTASTESTSPERAFDRAWALSLLEQTLARLRSAYESEGKTQLFDAIKPYLNFESDAVGYETTATLLNQTPAAVKTAVYRLRRRYRDTLRTIICDTVDTESQIDEEIAALFEAVRRA